MEKPWLSVIVPCLNGERWIGAALQSLVDQQDPGIEVLFVDGSADDTSLQIVESFSDKLNIRAHHRPDLVPWTAASNFGVEQARSDRICILHVDDMWLPNRSAKLREWLAVRSDGVMHLHPTYIIDGSGRQLGRWRCPLPAGQSPVPISMLFERLLVQNFISIRRRPFDAMRTCALAAWITGYGILQIGICILSLPLLAVSTTIRVP